MKVVVAGGTGLTGGFLIHELENDSSFESIVAITRKARKSSDKTTWKTIDFEDSRTLEEITKDVDVVFCCLGTTIKKAGSKDQFRKVDYEYVVNLAKAARSNNVRQFSLMSAVGADAKSKAFYNRVKGEVEEAVRGLGFDELILFQPSLLLGPREESRLGEKIGTIFGKLFSPLLFGAAVKYHPIHVSKIAKAMVSEAKIEGDRSIAVEYNGIIENG